MRHYDVILNNGRAIAGEKISELVNYIINKFADEELSFSEADVVINALEKDIQDYSIIRKN